MRLRDDVIALGATASSSLLWRVGGRVHMTVVVKATFRLVDGQRMALCEPQPMHADDVLLASGVGVVAPSDVAPYLGLTDVVVCASPRHRARIRVVLRGADRAIMDKTAALEDFAAIGASAPARLARLDKRLRDALTDEVPDLPVDMDWSYFQVAPKDQRVPLLSGDEWLLLRGLTSTDPVRSQLPGAAAAVWVWPRDGSFDDGYPVSMFADRVVIDGDAESVSLTWRGSLPLETAAVMTEICVAGGVHLRDAPIDWTPAREGAGTDDDTGITITGDGAVALAPPSKGRAGAGGFDTTDAIAQPLLGERDAPPRLAGGLERTVAFEHMTPADLGGLVGPDGTWSPAADAHHLEAAEDELAGTIGMVGAAPQLRTPYPIPGSSTRRALALLPIPGAPWAKQAMPPPNAERPSKQRDPMEATVPFVMDAPAPALPFAGRAAPPPPARGEVQDDGMMGSTAMLTPEEAATIKRDIGAPFPAGPNEPPPAAAVSPWASSAPSPRRTRGKSMNSAIRAELGIDAVSHHERGAAQSQAPPKPPARVAESPPSTAASRPPASSPPPAATDGEAFLAALAWLEKQKDS